MRAPYYLIAILVVILVIVLIVGSRSKTDPVAQTTGSDASGQPSQVQIALAELLADDSVSPAACQSTCKNLCSSCKYFGGGRLDCERACKSDCTKGGTDIRSKYPNC